MAYHAPPLKKGKKQGEMPLFSRVFIKELHDSHVGHACNDCNGSTICIYHEQKISAWHVIVLKIHILHIMKGSYMYTPQRHSYSRYGQASTGW